MLPIFVYLPYCRLYVIPVVAPAILMTGVHVPSSYSSSVLTPAEGLGVAGNAICPAVVTTPEKVGLAKLAFRSRAVCCAVETGLLASLVLVTFPNPTIVAVMPA